MKITILTLFPDMIQSFFEYSIVKKAQEKGSVEIEYIDIRDYAVDTYGTVDDRPYGGGAGMVMRVDVIDKALADHKSQIINLKSQIVLTSAKGKTYNQKKAQELSQLDHLILIAGHYEGFDERVLDYVDEEVSIGDFVLTGGEIAVAAIVDSVVRLLPGVLKKDEASKEESFFEVDVAELIQIVGNTEVLAHLKDLTITTVQLLEYPHYTRPEEYEGKKVPEVLLSGNHAEIRKWRLKKAYEETVKKRPDLLTNNKE